MLEQKLSPMIHVPFFVAGIPDDALGEKLALFVEQEEAFAFAKAPKSYFFPSAV